MMRRIYLEIYLSVVVTAVIAAVGFGGFAGWYFEGRHEAERAELQDEGARFVASLTMSAAASDVGRALEAWASDQRVTAVLWNADGEVVAAAGRRSRTLKTRDPVAGDSIVSRSSPWWRQRDRARRPRPWAWTSVPVSGGGTLELASLEPGPDHRFGPWIFMLGFLGVIAIAAYPVSRRITRGLENLREGVSELGEGDLGARIDVHGRNEVADVARAFNAAAAKIQQAVLAQRRVLASASHELRTPLGRLRAAVELIAAGHDERLVDAERDIEELDALIEDLLLTGRIGAGTRATEFETIDLRTLIAEEAGRAGAICRGEIAPIQGNARMLRRMIRNLIENAGRHGAEPITIELGTDQGAGRVRIVVADAGGGVPLEERERIFEPFYRAPGHSEHRDGGVGLGLSLVAEIATHHGGTVACVADPELGSVFVVELPSAAE